MTHIADTHPCLTGHFPGNPIVPGVVILDHILAALREQLGELEITHLPVVKFLNPLQPGQEFSIQLEASSPHEYIFKCHSGAGIIAQGKFEIKAEKEARP